MIEFIKQNVSWLKDLSTLIFATVGTLIAILTYRRARATILQPIRNEVIKKQSEILSELLQILKDKNNSFENGLDYENIVQLNVLQTLKDYGFVFKDNEKILSVLKDETSGWIPVSESKILKDVSIIGTFSDKLDLQTKNEFKDISKNKYENLKKGNAEIDKIHLTKKHAAFMKIISDFSNDPFMPSKIQETLKSFLINVQNNLEIILKREMEIFILNFGDAYFKKKEAPAFNPIGVYNSFNHSRLHHRDSYNKLRIEIRGYLRIDEKW